MLLMDMAKFALGEMVNCRYFPELMDALLKPVVEMALSVAPPEVPVVKEIVPNDQVASETVPFVGVVVADV